MKTQTTRQSIAQTLKAFSTGSLTENALNLFETLGYNTDRQDHLKSETDSKEYLFCP
ncbi:MAG: hypothetical protein WCI84_08515 [Bacteroidota bacterium]